MGLEAGLSPRTVTDIALAVNEAVSNAVMHAFPDREQGTVRLSFQMRDDCVQVDVCDDGVGLRVRDDSPGAGLGRSLMAAVADEVVEQPASAGGTHVRMNFGRA